MRAFVTGATGFLGINLVRELVAARWDVVALRRADSDTRFLDDLGVVFATGDVTDVESVSRAMPEGVDVVFHVAGDTTMWTRRRARQLSVNVDGSRNVGTVALEKRARRFVHTSSIAAFGHCGHRVTEETPSRALESPMSYPRSKRLGEMEIDRLVEAGLDAVIVNPSNIVGPFDVSNWARLIRMVVRKELPGIPPGCASWTHVREVARAHIAAAEHGRTGHRYLLGGADASHLEVVRTIESVTGVSTGRGVMPRMLLFGVGIAREMASYLTDREPDITLDGVRLVCDTTTCDCAKAIRELAYRPVPLRKMFQDCYDWLRSAELV